MTDKLAPQEDMETFADMFIHITRGMLAQIVMNHHEKPAGGDIEFVNQESWTLRDLAGFAYDHGFRLEFNVRELNFQREDMLAADAAFDEWFESKVWEDPHTSKSALGNVFITMVNSGIEIYDALQMLEDTLHQDMQGEPAADA